MDYQSLKDHLGDRREKLIKRSELKTTARLNEDDSISIKLVDTDIMTFEPDGKVTLDSGGWRTVTTKSRMNDYLPRGWWIYQDQSVWWVSYERKARWVFQDGMTLDTVTGTVTGAGDVADIKKDNKAVNKYVKDFVSELMAGKIERPGGGDCWYCLMKTEDGKSLGDIGSNDHISQHIEDKYYVPSLLVNAVTEYPVSPIAYHFLAELTTGNTDNVKGFGEGIVKDQVTSSLRRYLKRRMNLPVR